MRPKHKLVLRGINGTTPLGFLAALGLIGVLRNDVPDLCLAWTVSDGGWVAQLGSSEPLRETDLLRRLENTLVKSLNEHPARLYDKVKQRDDIFTEIRQQATVCARREADFLAAIAASNSASAEATSQLQTTRRDYHVGNIRSILEKTTRDHLNRTLFKSWDYADPLDNQSLHLDPSEDRRHAYQWHKPSGDPTRKQRGGMLGANRLAIEAFAWFTVWPVGKTLKTLGFSGFGRHETRWTWPLWTPFVPPDLIPSLLALAPLQDDPISAGDRQRLRHLGIAAVYRVQRILVGKTPNFTPACKIA
ncbi:MAG: type I-G CRISPR-associated protein, Cas3-extension family [Acidobacteriota bacterium]